MQSITLRSGYSVPQIGLGTWQLNGSLCTRTVAKAIEIGYRHIDTAFGYDNHREVGAGIRDSGVPRKELFLTTKIPLNKQRPAQVLGLAGRLPDELGTEYVDLLLIHWPDRNVAFADTLAAFKELVNDGRVRSIGISNFNADLVEEAQAATDLPLVTNQVEFHPLLFQKELMQRCHARDIRITAYSPMAQGRVMKDRRLGEIGDAHGATPAQVSIAWLVSKGIIAIPKASSENHLKANLEAAGLRLTDHEIERIDGFTDHQRVVDGPWKHYPLE